MDASNGEMTSSRYERGLDTSGASNPASSLGHLSTSTVSMRHKKQRKRDANAQHNCNFNAGYVPVIEDVLHRSGIRGRKRYFLYCTLAVTLVVALANTLVTGWLLYSLGMTHSGLGKMEIIEVAPSRPLVHFFAPAIASSIAMNGAPLGARRDSNISVTSQDSLLRIRSFEASSLSPYIDLEGDSITITADDVRVGSDKNKDKKWLSLDVETMASVYGISNFLVDSLTTKKVYHAKIQKYKDINDLYLESVSGEVNINGSEGIEIRSMKDLELTARNVSVHSDNAVIFQSKHSVYLDPGLPKVPTSEPKSRSQASKICMCGNGQLFLVPVASSASCDIGLDLARKICLQ